MNKKWNLKKKAEEEDETKLTRLTYMWENCFFFCPFFFS